jgi:hypothetical protein
MKLGEDSQPVQRTLFDGTPETPGDLIFSLTIPGRLPSWNTILGMQEWRRYQFKKELADAFLSALKASASDCSTKTTSAVNIMWTFADTLEFCLATRQAQRKLRSAKKRLGQKRQSKPPSKSTDCGRVPF